MNRAKPAAAFMLDRCSFEKIYGDELRREFEQRLAMHRRVLDRDDWSRHAEIVHGVEIIMGGWSMPVLDEAFLASAPNLRAVFYAGGSVRQVVTDAFWDRSITLVTAADLNAIPVAEYSLAMIILCLKNAFRCSAAMRLGSETAGLRDSIRGGYRSVVGLISLSATGRRTAELLRAVLDVEVIAYDPMCPPATAASLGVALQSLDDVFRLADVVSLHAPLLAETQGMITGRHLASMKAGAAFLNTARGAIVRENEMIATLMARPDLTAVLDVFAMEPLAAESPLRRLGNAVITPHIAGSSGCECRRLGRGMLEELDRYLGGLPLRWELNRRQAVHRA